jgi:hypothetical protein
MGPFDGRYLRVLAHIGMRLYGLPADRAARTACHVVMREIASRMERPCHNYPLVVMRNDAIAHRAEQGLPPPTFDHDLFLAVAYTSTLALLKPRYRRAIRQLIDGGQCCHSISPRFGWTRDYFHAVFDRFEQRVVQAYHVLKGDTLDEMLEGLRALRKRSDGRQRVTCLACTNEWRLDVEPGESATCACGSKLVLIEGVSPAEWNRRKAN